MNRRRIALGMSAVGGVAALSAGVANMVSSASAPQFKLNADPVAAIRDAGSATAQAGTADVDTVVTMTTPALPAKGTTPAAAAKTTTMHGTGLFDFGREIGRVDLVMANGQLEEVLTPASLYLRSQDPASTGTPAAVEASNAAKPWSRVDIGRLADGNVVSGGSTDPAVTVAMLSGVSPDVKYEGQDVVRGTAVAHYSGTLDLKQAADVPAATGDANAVAQKKALGNAAHAFTTTKVPFEAYIDTQGRLRRFVARFQFTLPGPAHAKADVTSATELYGFGVQVGIQTPASAAGQSAAASAAPATSAATPAPTPGASGAKPGTSSAPVATTLAPGHTPTGHAPSASGTHTPATPTLSPSRPVPTTHK